MINNKFWIAENYIPGLVSVIIPTYNRQVFLKEAVKTVVAQTYRPIECIVIDDGSTDNTKEIINYFILNNNNCFNIKYIYQENAGSQKARNTGTIASQGEFIQYLDSDDLLNPDKIKTQVEYLFKNPDVDGIFGDWYKGTLERRELNTAYQSDDMMLQLLTERCIANFAFLMRRDIVNKIGEWDENIKRNQEIDFQVRGLLKGAKYDYQPLNCGLWRIHKGERIATKTTLKDTLYFFQKWEVVLTKRDVFNLKIKQNIALIYFSYCIGNNYKIEKEKINMLMEAVRLNPDISFINTRKMCKLRKAFGLRISIRMWLIRAAIFNFFKKKGLSTNLNL